jgi:hypothetical protein
MSDAEEAKGRQETAEEQDANEGIGYGGTTGFILEEGSADIM